MAETQLLQDLAVVLAVAGLMTLLCRLLSQPVVLGYIIAGLIIGPYSPPFALVQDVHSINTMAELGLVFLMFTLGLEFNLPKLKKVGIGTTVAGLFEVSILFCLGIITGKILGWSFNDCIFLGGIISISSTTIIAKVLGDLNLTQKKFAQVVFGILILEDIVAIVIVSVLSTFAAQQNAAGTTIALQSLLKVGLFVTLFLVTGLLTVPRFLAWISRFQSKEMIGIFALALCFCAALLAEHLGFSIALGAFLIGAVIAASNQVIEIEEWTLPLKDMFSSIFFVAVGMMIQPQIIWTYKVPILLITLIVIAGKFFASSLSTLFTGFGIKNSIKIGSSLAQIGEFSFVIAALGISQKATSNFLYPIAVTVSSITTFTTPYLIRSSEEITQKLVSFIPRRINVAFENYERWIADINTKKQTSPLQIIFNKYFSRFLVYFTLTVCVFLCAQTGSKIIDFNYFNLKNLISQTILWAMSGFICLPLFLALARYINHIFLVLFTWALGSSKLFLSLDIQRFYKTSMITVFVLQGSIFLWQAGLNLEPKGLVTISVLLLITLFSLQKTIIWIKEQMEIMLDEVLGLTSSEPGHQAKVLAEQNNRIAGFSEQILVQQNFAAVGKSLGHLNLRTRSGAMVAAIYRDKEVFASPRAESIIYAQDILVLWGNLEQREKAKKIVTEELS